MRPSVRFFAIAAVLLVAGCSTATTAVSAPGATSRAPMSMAMPVATDPPGTVRGAASRLVEPAEFAAAVATRGTITIDVHVPFFGKIAGTNLMIPYTDISAQASKLPADHHTELAIYCRTGVMSAIAAKTLSALGYPNVVELRGGMYAWEATGRTLLSTP